MGKSSRRTICPSGKIGFNSRSEARRGLDSHIKAHGKGSMMVIPKCAECGKYHLGNGDNALYDIEAILERERQVLYGHDEKSNTSK